VRAVEVADDRRLVVVDRPAPHPGPGQVVVDVRCCGICGSDLHFRDVPELFPAGTVPGHELAGAIAALGSGVAGWSVGDRVCVLPFAQCGECALCRAGEEQVCPDAVPNGVGLGTGRPGGYAEQLIVDQRMLFALPDAVDDQAGTLVEPLAVAVRAVATAALSPDEPTVVLGAGPIGVLTALVLHHQGHGRITLVSRGEARRVRAAELGVATRSLAELHSAPLEPPACVFECAGTPEAARLAVELARPRGRVMLVGMSLAALDLAAPPILLKELTLRGVISYRRAEFARAIELLADGRLPARSLVTEVVPLEWAETSFQALTSPGNDQLKVLLRP
jgi:threonine dehydrogenase-like Zn-dependent dehydrogenase